MKIFDLFLIGIRNLSHRRLRSYLTMLGILIGITAVVALISMGQGMEDAITEQFESVGSNIIMVMGSGGGMSSPIMSMVSEKPLTVKDKEVIESVKGVNIVAEYIIMPASVGFHGEKTDSFLGGSSPGPTREIIEASMNAYREAGRELKEGDRYKAVIGNNIAHTAFDREVSIGDKITILGQEFRVVGIYEKIGNAMDDNSIMIPIDIMRDLIDEKEKISMLYLNTKKGYDVQKVAENIEEELRDYRDEDEGDETFVVSTASDLLETFGSILNIVQAVVVGLAAISLLVGGVGIMNTMYMAVMERTREIGTMKAIGATNADILTIFLVESGVLGMIGGIVGVTIGLGISKLVEIAVTQFYGTPLIKAHVSLVLIGGAVAFSFIVGMMSGIFPAKQASSLKPVDALRYE